MLAICVAAGRPAAAELAYFTSGGSLSIRDHRVEGESLVLTLRAGGEIVCDRALIVRFAPDEVPYPEPPFQRPRAALPRRLPSPTTYRSATSSTGFPRRIAWTHAWSGR